MYKIENFLLLNKLEKNTILLDVAKQYLKEFNLLITNLHQTYVVGNEENTIVLPHADSLYDISWYKNILIASEIIDDRLNSKILEDKNYVAILSDPTCASFTKLAATWNKINLMISFNIPESEWIQIYQEFSISDSSIKLQALVDQNVQFNMEEFNKISLDLNQYVKVKTIDENHLEASINENPSNDPIDAKVEFDNLEIRVANEAIDRNVKNIELILKWLKTNEKNIKLYKSKMKIKAASHELDHINKLLAALDKYLTQNETSLKALKDKLPENSLLNDLSEMSAWAEGKQEDIHINNIKKEHGQNAADIYVVEKEIAKTEAKLNEVSEIIHTRNSEKQIPEAVKGFEEASEWTDTKQSSIASFKKKKHFIKTAAEVLPEDVKARVDQNIDSIVKNTPDYDNSQSK
ncbi:MAG: hypothetical protein ACRC4M_01415 [Mycoplasma sp.]